MGIERQLIALCLLALGFLAAGAAPPTSDPVEVDILKLTSIDWKQGQELPKWIRDLDGKEVVISGFMFAQFRDETDELLIIGNSCQCSGTPLPQHFVKVKLDKKTSYKGGELTFIGKFSASEVVEDGFVTSLYRLDGKFF